jgi:hypothetical protein
LRARENSNSWRECFPWVNANVQYVFAAIAEIVRESGQQSVVGHAAERAPPTPPAAVRMVYSLAT